MRKTNKRGREEEGGRESGGGVRRRRGGGGRGGGGGGGEDGGGKQREYSVTSSVRFPSSVGRVPPKPQPLICLRQEKDLNPQERRRRVRKKKRRRRYKLARELKYMMELESCAPGIAFPDRFLSMKMKR